MVPMMADLDLDPKSSSVWRRNIDGSLVCLASDRKIFRLSDVIQPRVSLDCLTSFSSEDLSSV